MLSQDKDIFEKQYARLAFIRALDTIDIEKERSVRN